MPDQPFFEKRKHPRIYKHFILSYYDLNDPLTRHDASQLKNLSRGGMCFVTAKVYPEGTRLGIELRTPFLSEFIHLRGTVLESKEKLKGIICETRLQFDEPDPETQIVLQQLIHHFEHEKGPKS